MGADIIVLGLSSITSGTCFARLWGWGCLPPRPQGIVDLTLSLYCLARPVSLLGDRATCIHLEGLPKGRVNGWLSPKSGSFVGGNVTCVLNLDSKSLPNKGSGHSGMYKN